MSLDETLREMAFIANRESLRVQGFTPWYDEHPLDEGSESLYLFLRIVELQLYKEGRRQRRVLAARAAEEVNAKFHHERSAKSVRQFIHNNKETWEAFQAVYGTPFVPKCRPSRSESRRRVLRKSGLYSWKDTAPDGHTYLEHLFAFALNPQYQHGERYKSGRIAAELRREYGLRCDADSVTQALRTYHGELEAFQDKKAS